MKRGIIKIRPEKEYNYLDMPTDAEIVAVAYRPKCSRICIYYVSKSGRPHSSDGAFGFEYNAFMEGKEVFVVTKRDNEIIEKLVDKEVDCDGMKVRVVILKWTKK